ncbi:hypothetical protein OKA05_13230 [Luteolibacter arcticus]|uniref:O-antigen ligase domain-containing protein n=1 Tax=Luteolibacter arcticus TaxID=1581411 RepID=A0ABT3GJ61_9BACT|nr:hypothetical protein [Luteolibacter arcticus]MCW1923521.1 hypothetical protein [Luteolibacter arcticus]
MVESRSIQGILIVIVVAVLAAWLGVAIVTNQTQTLLKVGGVSLLALCILLGRRIWLLMIFFTALNFPLIRGFNTAELGQGLFFGFSLLLFAIRKLPVRPKWGELEWWMLLVALCVVQAYLRNPVGLNIFGGASVGARPYFVISLSFLSSWLLSILLIPGGEIKWAMRLTLLGSIVGIPISEARTRAGLQSVGAFDPRAAAGRFAWLASAALTTIRWLVSRISPFRAILKPWAFILLLACLAAAAGSGYRNVVAAAGLYGVVAIYYHHGMFAALGSTFLASVCIGLLAVINLFAPLPGTMQRALSPFPGTWEERYVRAGELSTEWRVEMWKEALFTDTWIQNKLLGDGLGMTRRELRRMEDLSAGGADSWAGSSGLSNQQESMMITGSYHSGPVQTVRTVGYVGLIVLVLAMLRVAAHMHRLIKRVKGTEWFPVVLFMSLPNLILPFQFVFVFGEFGPGCSLFFFGFGMLRLMERNLPVSRTSPQASVPVMLPRGRGRAEPQLALSSTKR